MTPMRVVIVEDEPITRNHLLALLQDEQDVEVVGTCGDGKSAAATIAETTPDLVFLDIQLPELDGLSLARTLPLERRPAVVFVTAHDHYALPAFEIHALDYLMKPFSAERFRSSLQYARRHVLQQQASSLGQRILELVPGASPSHQSAEASPTALARLMVRSSGRVYFVRVTDVDWCEAAGNYACLHVGAHTHMVRETMSRLESQLDPRRFARIHRSVIVNLDRVVELRSSFNGEHVVTLRDGTRLTMSRGYRGLLQTRLAEIP